MILAVSMEVWVMRLIMEMMLSPVSSNHLLGSWTMPLALSVLVGWWLVGHSIRRDCGQRIGNLECVMLRWELRRSHGREVGACPILIVHKTQITSEWSWCGRGRTGRWSGCLCRFRR